MDIRPLISRYDLWSPQIITTYSGTNFGSGSIELEYDWQLIAVPIQFGYWDLTLHKHVHDGLTVAKFKNYLMDQIDDLYGLNQISVANAYVGGTGNFYSFVPGSTPESSPHNFNLCYQDSGSVEITGFWIRSLSISPILISWGEGA